MKSFSAFIHSCHAFHVFHFTVLSTGTSKNLTVFRFTEALQKGLTMTTCERTSGFSSCGLPMCQTVCVCVCGAHFSFCLCAVKEDLLSNYSRSVAAWVPHRRLSRLRFCRRHLSAITHCLLTTKSFHTAIIFTQYLAPRAWNSRTL